MTKKQKKLLYRILVSAGLFAVCFAAEKLFSVPRAVLLLINLLPYFTAGYDVLLKSGRNILHGQVFDEAFLMSLATVGALVIGEYHEAVFVMVFYQTGELFQSIAIGKSRRSISSLMDIRPDSATVIRNGREEEVDPEEVSAGEILLVRPGEKIPLDGTVISGSSSVNTSALTGESIPADVIPGDALISGTVNLTGTLTFRAEKEYGESTAAKILELVENSSLHKAKSERFLTRFAKYYTPAVVIAALLLAVIPSVITGNVKDWVYRALIFLVVSCPCALLISVPLSFFGGIGGASSKGILVKGADRLEALADVKTAVFDKTGTLTSGEFEVTDVIPAPGVTAEELLKKTARAEYYSNHPIALSVRASVKETVSPPGKVTESAGLGVTAVTGDETLIAGNYRMMKEAGIVCEELFSAGTAVYCAENGNYLGAVIIADKIKKNAAEAIRALSSLGVTRTVMLTGDREKTASETARKLGITEYRSGLLPEDKVSFVDELCRGESEKEKTVFVGDGINDAPVLMRADVGIAMGALGSDAAIEAADAVIMDDDPLKIAAAVRTARKTRRIVRENVLFALTVKFSVLLLAAFGLTELWIGVLADVGVAVIAVLNAMRTLKGTE